MLNFVSLIWQLQQLLKLKAIIKLLQHYSNTVKSIRCNSSCWCLLLITRLSAVKISITQLPLTLNGSACQIHTDSVALWQTHDSHWGDEYALDFYMLKQQLTVYNRDKAEEFLLHCYTEVPHCCSETAVLLKAFQSAEGVPKLCVSVAATQE